MSWSTSEWADYTWTLLIDQLHLVDVKELQERLENFVCENKEWCEGISKRVLDRKGLTFSEYFYNLISGAIPPDEIALCIVAKMYKKHIAVLIGYEYWSTMKVPNFKEAAIKLVYLGGMKFLSTTEGRTSGADEFFVQTLIHDLVHGPKERVRSAVKTARVMAEALKQRDERQKNENKSNDKDGDTMQANEAGTMQTTDGDTMQANEAGTMQTTDGDTMPPKKKKIFETKKVESKAQVQEARTIGEILFSDEKSTSSFEDAKNDDAEWVPPAGTNVVPKRKRGMASSTRAAKKSKPNKAEKVETHETPETQETNPKPKKRKKNTTTKPVGERSSARIAKKAKQDKAQKAVARAKKSKPKKGGSFQVALHGIPKRKPRPKKDIKCPLCNEKFANVSKANKHLGEAHKGLKIKCKECPAEFLTFNARVKHMAKHREMKFICDTCGRQFPYENQLNEHERKHGKKGTGKIRCSVVSCDKKFCSKRAMKHHVKSHTEKKEPLKCDLCEKTFGDKGLLQQHRRGAHGTQLGLSYKTHCGIELNSNGKQQRHQRDCDACQKFIAKRFNKAFLKRRKRGRESDNEYMPHSTR